MHAKIKEAIREDGKKRAEYLLEKGFIPESKRAGKPLGLIRDIDKEVRNIEAANAIKRANGIIAAGQTSFVAARQLRGYSENQAKQNLPKPRKCKQIPKRLRK